MALVNGAPGSAPWLLRGLAWALSCAALACGDALVDSAYSGTPLFTVLGSVSGTSEYVNAEHPDVSIALFWSLQGQQPGPGEDTVVEQPGTSLRAEYYRAFALRLFDEPEGGNLFTRPSGARYGVAYLGAYRDVNGNGARDASEPLIGATNGRLLLRAPEALSARDSPTGAPLPAGWHVVSTPLACPWTREGSGSGPVADGDCGVPLGVTCMSDAECGAGVCIREFLGPWPGGACAIPEPPRNGCRQRGSVLLKAPDDSTKAFWLKGCAVSADCGRIAPYQCDQQLRVCRPSVQMPVEVNDRGPPRSFCEPPPRPTPP